MVSVGCEDQRNYPAGVLGAHLWVPSPQQDSFLCHLAGSSHSDSHQILGCELRRCYPTSTILRNPDLLVEVTLHTSQPPPSLSLQSVFWTTGSTLSASRAQDEFLPRSVWYCWPDEWTVFWRSFSPPWVVRLICLIRYSFGMMILCCF